MKIDDCTVSILRKDPVIITW